jgi:hypothetical protein
MTSSTSSSECPAAVWERWLATFLGVLVTVGAGLFAALVILDPYDTGRFGLLPSRGVSDENPRTANASRGRDQQFEAAVFGSSTGQILHPNRLSQLSGLSFVQLTIPGTRAREQLALMRWFLQHHERVGALVVVTDESWCTAEAGLPIANPFPFWLYSDRDLEYLRNIFSSRSLGRARRQIEIWLGRRPRSDPKGYWDYELGRVWNFHPDVTRQEVDFPELSSDGAAPFPAIDRLRDVVEALSHEVPAVVVMPPIFFTQIPPLGTRAALRLATCKTAIANVLAGRPRGGFLDFRVVNATTRDPANFMDTAHYRAGVAKKIERSIATAITMGRTVVDF